MHRHLLLTTAISGLVLLPNGAMAQDTTSAPAAPTLPTTTDRSQTPPATAETEGPGLQDIVVTAEKRTSTVQRTPASISVLTGEQLARNGVGNLQDLAATAPGLSLNQSGPSFIVAIRGVSSRDVSEVGDPAVAISLDGAYIQRPIGINDAMFDLARVEVLRGPQGTLYGRNATGGAINIITNKPTKTFGGSVHVGLGNYNLVTSEAVINIPVSDDVQIRAGFFSRNHNGYRNNAPSANGDDADTRAARIHLAAQPTSRLQILLTGEYTHLGGVGSTIVGTPLITDADGNVDHNLPALPRHGERWALSLPDQFQRSRSLFARGTIDYDLDFATLTYIGSYRDLHFKRFYDIDGTAQIDDEYLDTEKVSTQSHEVRLASKGSSRFRWQAGLYYFNEKNSLFSTYTRYAPDRTQERLFVFDYPLVKAVSKAAFAQASYKILDNISLEGGIRYTDDQKIRRGTAVYDGDVQSADGRYDGDKVNYHAAVNWQVTPSKLLYAKFDTGYKAGGFTTVNQYGPEQIKAWEIGSKNRLFDNSLQLNVSAFYYKYTGQQIDQLQDGQDFIFNAGKSRIYGGDVEAVARLSTADQLDLFVSYTHAEFTQFCTVVAAVCPAEQNLAGNRLPAAPAWQVGGGFQHEFDLGRGTLTPRVQSRFESASYLTFNQFRSEQNGAYSRTDITLTYSPKENGLSISAFVRNLENSLVVTAANEQPFFGTYTYQFADPRTYGVRVGFSW